MNFMDKLITDDKLRQGAEEGMDAFLKVFTDAYLEVIEGELTAERARFKFTWALSASEKEEGEAKASEKQLFSVSPNFTIYFRKKTVSNFQEYKCQSKIHWILASVSSIHLSCPQYMSFRPMWI